MLIAGHEIGAAPFIIGEAGLNTNGDPNTAREMVWAARHAGCTAIKFQTFVTEEFCQPDDPMFPAFKRAELPRDCWAGLKAECDKAGLIFLSTPQNRGDLDVLLPLGLPAIKVGSDDLTNTPLLADYASAGLPMILSCGMSDLGEVLTALSWTRTVEKALLVCTSQYPCPPEEANLARITTLRRAFPALPIGFSDHTLGPWATIAAVGLGACVFEKHFTLDKAMQGPDHHFSASPDELVEWVSAIRTAHQMLGPGIVGPSPLEREQKAKYQRRPGAQLRGSGEPT